MGRPARGLFFLAASNGELPMPFIQALLALGYRPIPLSGGPHEKVVDLAIQRTSWSLQRRRSGDVMLVSHDGDFLPLEGLLDGRRLAVVAFEEFRNSGFLRLADRGLEFFDLEYDVKAFRSHLPRVRVIPIDEFDPADFLYLPPPAGRELRVVPTRFRHGQSSPVATQRHTSVKDSSVVPAPRRGGCDHVTPGRRGRLSTAARTGPGTAAWPSLRGARLDHALLAVERVDDGDGERVAGHDVGAHPGRLGARLCPVEGRLGGVHAGQSHGDRQRATRARSTSDRGLSEGLLRPPNLLREIGVCCLLGTGDEPFVVVEPIPQRHGPAPLSVAVRSPGVGCRATGAGETIVVAGEPSRIALLA